MHNKFIGLFGLTLASLASSVNAATYNLADYFFPVQQGSSWIYVDQDGRYIRWLLSNVNYSQTLCNGTTRKVLLFDESQGDYVGTNYVPAESWQEYYSIATGYSYCGHSQDSPIVLMTPVSLQMNIGQSVSRQLDVYDGSCQHVVSSATVSIVEQTSVTFPSGGSYPDCLHLHFVTPNMVYDEWWARGVGIVKSVNVSGHNAGHTLQLISMTMTDLTKPVVSILSPTSGQQIKANSEQWLVKGTASDNVGVLQVLVNLNNTGWQPATGTTGWQILMNLQAGPNTVAAYAVDAAGNQSATSNVNFTYVLTAPLLVAAVGQGTINPNYSNAVLEIGLPYNVTAAGVNGHQFRRWEVATNWLNPAVVTNATLNFVMQANLTLTVVFADTNRPMVAVANLVANQRISNAVFTVRGRVTDNAGVSNVWYRLNGAPDWLAANGVVAGRTSLWSAPLVLEQPTNKFEVWAEDATGNRSATNSVSFAYVKMFTLTDYYPLPLGAYWLYDGTDSRGDPTKFSFEVTDTNYVITTYAGTKPVIGYTTNCVRVSAAYLDDTTLVPYENWNEYLAIGGRFGYFGDDDLPSESMRFAGGLIAPAQMAVGASVTLKTNAYMFGTNAGTASISFQLIERTNMTVPVGSFPDVLHTRWNMAYPGGAQVHDEWWAKWVGRIKRLHISGNSSAVSYELIQYSLPPAHGIAAKAAAPNGLGVPNLPLQFECCDGSLAVANRGAQMKLSGAPGAVVVVESSPDLVHWLPNQTNILTGGQMYFSDPQWTNYTRRFYRLRAP